MTYEHPTYPERTYRVLGCIVEDNHVTSDVPDEEAEFWSVYERHGDDGTANANLEFVILDDFPSREAAEAALNVPDDGTKVRVLRQAHTREVGESNMMTVEPGSVGTIEGYVIDWFDVHVKLDDGREVWISPDNLERVDE